MRGFAAAKQEPMGLPSKRARPDEPAALVFPPFRLDFTEERLWKGERELRLRPKPFAILRILAQNPRRLVTHAEIVDAVWGRTAMSESLLRTHVRDLRRALGDAVIETVVGRGYRFVPSTDAFPQSDGTERLELVRTSEPPQAVTTVDAEPARLLKQVVDAVNALGTPVTVVVIVGDTRLSSGTESSQARFLYTRVERSAARTTSGLDDGHGRS
jgi:DNA-binding winged helix-turn-helix (wHTH) protein